MSAISANPNRNPKSPDVSHPSTSNQPKKSMKSKRKKRNSKKKKHLNRNPNWLELPEDVWFLILSNLSTFDKIENVQKVCMLFRRICKQPSMFKSIDMCLPDPDAYLDFPEGVISITSYAVDLSAGCLIDIYLDYVDDETLMYIVDRSKNLKHLRLGYDIDVSSEGLIQAIQKVPMLEEVQLIRSFSKYKIVEAIGCTCSSLKSFSLTLVGSRKWDYSGNEDALAIAKSMPQLRHLQLIGNQMTNQGLKAILNGCPLLESLDFHACFNIDLSGDLGKRCARIKHSRHPDDSSMDYGRLAYEEENAYQLRAEGDSEYEFDSDYSCFLDMDFDDYTYFEDYYPDYFEDDGGLPHFYDFFSGNGIPDYGFSD